MHPFYVSLNSDGSKDILFHNHGDDFNIELYVTLDLTGRWEIGLVKMSYFGQYFPNIPKEYGGVKVSTLKSSVRFNNLIVNYGKVKDLHFDVYMNGWKYLREEGGCPVWDL